MNRFRLSPLLLVLQALTGSQLIAATISPPFSNGDITSVFGPRMLSSGFNFHEGLDYAEPTGTPIPSIEDGTVVFIKGNDADGGGWRMRITGSKTGRDFFYMHLFPSNATVGTVSGGFQLGFDTINKIYFITRLSDGKIFKGPVFNSQGTVISPGTGIVSGEFVGPVGNSGDAEGGSVLHLQYGTDIEGTLANPFVFVAHDPSNFAVTYINPPSPNFIVPIGNLSNFAIDFKINQQIGLDLDAVRIFVDNIGLAVPSDSVNPAPNLAFRYGGQVNQIQTNSVLTSAGETAPSLPSPLSGNATFLVNPGSKGFNEFIVQNINISGLSDGSHTINIIPVNALNNQSPVGGTSVNFTIDKTPPIITSIVGNTNSPDLSGGGVTTATGLQSITVTDDSSISGIQIYEGDPNAGGTLITSNNTVYVNSHIYTSSELSMGTLSKGFYFIVATDQAGNTSIPVQIFINPDSSPSNAAPRSTGKPIITNPPISPVTPDGPSQNPRDYSIAIYAPSNLCGAKLRSVLRSGQIPDMPIKVTTSTFPNGYGSAIGNITVPSSDEGNYTVIGYNCANSTVATGVIITSTTRLQTEGDFPIDPGGWGPNIPGYPFYSNWNIGPYYVGGLDSFEFSFGGSSKRTFINQWDNGPQLGCYLDLSNASAKLQYNESILSYQMNSDGTISQINLTNRIPQSGTGCTSTFDPSAVQSLSTSTAVGSVANNVCQQDFTYGGGGNSFPLLIGISENINDGVGVIKQDPFFLAAGISCQSPLLNQSVLALVAPGDPYYPNDPPVVVNNFVRARKTINLSVGTYPDIGFGPLHAALNVTSPGQALPPIHRTIPNIWPYDFLSFASNALDLSTSITAGYTGNPTLTFDYSSVNLSSQGVTDPNSLKLIQILPNGSAQDITASIKTASKTVMGITSTLGMYALAVIDTSPPTASISLLPSTIIKAGTTIVTLTASHPLSGIPILSFTPLGRSPITVNLVNISTDGSNRIWNGTISISSTTGDGIATFSWSGIGSNGVTGSSITSGGSFLIDSYPPSASLQISPKSPVTAGTLNITLNSSKPLGGAPSLSYITFGGSTYPVALMNQNMDSMTWTGTVNITGATGDGTATFNWSGFDLLGVTNTVITSGQTFVIDTIPPTASITISPQSPVKAGVVNLTLKTSQPLGGAPSLSFTPQGGSSIPISLGISGDSITWTGAMSINSNTGDGTATFNWSGFDIAGNTGTVIVSGGTFVIDTVPPTASITISPQSPVPIGSVSVNLTASKTLQSSSLTYTLQGQSTPVPILLLGSGSNWTGSINVTQNSGDGIAQFSWTGIDLAGNMGTSLGGTTSFEIDSTPPIGNLKINNDANTTTSPVVTVTFNAADFKVGGLVVAPKSVLLSLDQGATYTEIPYSPSMQVTLPTNGGVTLPNGQGIFKQVFAKFKDVAGNISQAVNNGIVLDTSGPPQGVILLRKR